MFSSPAAGEPGAGYPSSPSSAPAFGIAAALHAVAPESFDSAAVPDDLGDELFQDEVTQVVSSETGIITTDSGRHATAKERLEEMEDLQGQVAAFLEQLPSKEGRQVLDRLLRRLAAGEPLSARKVSDRVDESCEFLAELLQFCQGGPEMLAQVLQSAAGGDPGTQE
ncbi:unnamed protein product, partial [Polarella glacialis]